MKICAAQVKAFKGAIQKNIEHHLEFINRAVSTNAAIIIFPELSLTGYEPGLANDLAIDINDARLDIFQEKADAGNIIITVGAPVKSSGGINIGMVIFAPHQFRQLYSKQFLHEDEYPFFVPGDGGPAIIAGASVIAFAICYELSVPQHAQNASKNGANIYLASVSKTAGGMESANRSLSEIAARFSAITMICNSVGYCDNFESAGGSAAWSTNGKLLSQLNHLDEDLLIIETDS